MVREESLEGRAAERHITEIGEGETKPRRQVVAKVLDVVGGSGSKVERKYVGVPGTEDGESVAVEDLEAKVGGGDGVCEEIEAVGSEVGDGRVKLFVGDHGSDV